MQDFVCEKCGAHTLGTHCSKCLWSKHVDVNPGDRSAVCRGLMEPVSIEKQNIIYRCHVCDKKVKNKIAPDDNKNVLTSLHL